MVRQARKSMHEGYKKTYTMFIKNLKEILTSESHVCVCVQKGNIKKNSENESYEVVNWGIHLRVVTCIIFPRTLTSCRKPHSISQVVCPFG